MTDAWYFNNSRRPTVPFHLRHLRRLKARHSRRQPSIKMDILSQQQSYVARYDDPKFWSNNMSTLTCQFDFSAAFSDENDDGPNLMTTDDNDWNRDIPPSDDPDEYMLDFPYIISPQVCVFSPYRETTYNETPQATTTPPALTPSHPSTSSILGSTHPRPQTPGTRDEEDNRRRRLALSGPDTDELAQVSIRDDCAIRQELHQPLVQHAAPISHTRHPTSLTSARSLPNLLDIANSSTRVSASRLSEYLAESYFYRVEDDDNLAVDDQRRSYDFADFMDLWHSQSILDSQTPAFQPCKNPSMKLWIPPEEVRQEDVVDEICDMQGIRWQDIGPTREQALEARRVLHPSRRGLSDKSSEPWTNTSNEESHYRFRSFIPQHRAQFSHYQLRNVLAANNRSDIFYAQGSNVIQTTTACPFTHTTVMDLTKRTTANPTTTFRITCLATSPPTPFPTYTHPSILLAGGFNGEYALLNLSSPSTTQPTIGHLTHLPNGLVTHIHTYNHRLSGLPHAAFGTNDHKLRLLDLSTQAFTQTHTYAHAINATATSPDGRLRLLAGDANDLLLTCAASGTILTSLAAHTDHAFAAAWSSHGTGTTVASAAQDGLTCVWDARNWASPVHRLPSSTSCARTLGFAAGDGALIVGEAEDVVRVYDGVNFEGRQEVRFFGSIAGVVILGSEGEELVVANSDRTVGGLMAFRRGPGRKNGRSRQEVNELDVMV